MVISSSAPMLASAHADDGRATRAVSARRLRHLPLALHPGGDRRAARRDGAPYVVPGSHQRGRIEPYYDENTSYKFWAVPKREMIEVLRSSPAPAPIVGPAGTCVLFHCNLLHASGHNLSAEDRWHIYLSFNACANAPRFTAQSRADWVVSRNTQPLPIEADDAVLNSVLST